MTVQEYAELYVRTKKCVEELEELLGVDAMKKGLTDLMIATDESEIAVNVGGNHFTVSLVGESTSRRVDTKKLLVLADAGGDFEFLRDYISESKRLPYVRIKENK